MISHRDENIISKFLSLTEIKTYLNGFHLPQMKIHKTRFNLCESQRHDYWVFISSRDEDCENEFSSLSMEMKTHITRFNLYESQRLDYWVFISHGVEDFKNEFSSPLWFMNKYVFISQSWNNEMYVFISRDENMTTWFWPPRDQNTYDTFWTPEIKTCDVCFNL